MTAPLDRVLARLPNAKQVGGGWRDRCPAHRGGSTDSLSITRADDDRVLLHCHAGCPPEAVLAALGLTARDLFPPRAGEAICTGRSQGTGGASRRIVATYDYVGADGAVVYQTVRRDPKGFFQRRPDGRGGWVPDLRGVERVLYRLPDLLASPRAVWLPEGEKDADALAARGLVATTAAGGASAPWLPQYTDALRGRHVVLLADNDDPGRARARRVARALLGVAASVRVVDLPGLPPKGDVSDWLASGGTKEALVRLARGTPPLTAADIEDAEDAEDGGNPSYLHASGRLSHRAGVPDVPPFPVEVFPEALRRYVVEGAAALGVPADMVAVPLLAFAAGAIGDTRALRVKAGWVVRAILWLAVVGDPGSGKSPALDHARHPLDVLQKAAWEAYRAALLQWEQDAAAAKAAKPPDPPPPRPTLEHFFTTDATMEALAAILGGSPGVVVVRDELVGWVKSHDAYRKAGDRQNWLSLWAGAPLKVDRRGAGTLYVPRPTASVVGGIQPDLLVELAEEAHRRDGFVDRLLACWPTADPPHWTEATVDPGTTAAAEALVAGLRPAIRPEEPRVADLSPAARRAFARWYDENARLVQAAGGLAAGCYAKYPGQGARIALVLHGLHHPTELDRAVDAGTVLDAIAVVEYFRGHLARVLPAFGAVGPTTGAGVAGRVGRLLERAAGDWISRSELHRGLGGNVDAGELTAALQGLGDDGRAEGRSVPTGAKQREEWRWTGPGEPTGDDTVPKNEDMKNCPGADPKSPYLHIFGADTPAEHDGEAVQETLL